LFDQVAYGRACSGPVVDQDGWESFTPDIKVNEDDRDAEVSGMFDELKRDFPRHDESINVAFEQESGEIVAFGETLANGGKKDVEIVLACGKFYTEKHAIIERFGLGKMVFAEDETDISACLRGKPPGGAGDVISEVFDNLQDTFTCFFAHVPPVIDDKRYSRERASCFSRNILYCRAVHVAAVPIGW
jgi:hypothetical protein